MREPLREAPGAMRDARRVMRDADARRDALAAAIAAVCAVTFAAAALPMFAFRRAPPCRLPTPVCRPPDAADAACLFSPTLYYLPRRRCRSAPSRCAAFRAAAVDIADADAHAPRHAALRCARYCCWRDVAAAVPECARLRDTAAPMPPVIRRQRSASPASYVERRCDGAAPWRSERRALRALIFMRAAV